MKDKIKEFILNCEDIKDGFSVQDIQKYYKRLHDVRPNRSEVIDACLELRKEGVIKNDFENLVMKFT